MENQSYYTTLTQYETLSKRHKVQNTKSSTYPEMSDCFLVSIFSGPYEVGVLNIELFEQLSVLIGYSGAVVWRWEVRFGRRLLNLGAMLVCAWKEEETI